jgi:GT2 family glycosyltransferase
MLNYIIVTNTYHRPTNLVERCVRASLNQKIKPQKVILINQNEVPIKLSEDISSNPLFEIQITNTRSVSSARNSLKIPEGIEWIVFCDDDGYLCPGYTEKLNQITNKNDLEIIAGSIVRDDNSNYYSLRHKKGGSLRYFRNTKNLMGSNFIIKAKVFDDLGRFDEDFGAGSYWGSSEETDFCWKAYFAGKKMEFFPELIVYHVPPFNESLRDGFKKAFQYGVGKGAMVSKWLFYKRKIKVLYELAEMVVVPLLQFFHGLFTFKIGLMLNNFATLSGRFFGMIKYPLVK